MRLYQAKGGTLGVIIDAQVCVFCIWQAYLNSVDHYHVYSVSLKFLPDRIPRDRASISPLYRPPRRPLTVPDPAGRVGFADQTPREISPS